MAHDIRNPFDDTLIASIPAATEQDVRDAISRAVAARETIATMPAYRRAAILNDVSRRIEANSDDLALLMARESGKPLRYAKGEVARAAETFAFAAEEAKRIHGETVPLDAAKGGIGKLGYYMRVPVGVVAAITPFNFPLNLVAHKVAPAVAAGCPIVLKPAPMTPLTALRLAELFREAGLPDGAFSVVVGGVDVGKWLTTDPRVQMITFTGSPPVARAISEVAGLRRTTFELGGNAGVIIDAGVDALALVDRLVVGSFAYSGQVCISVQRIYVHRSSFDAFTAAFVACSQQLTLGDPADNATELGPVITEDAAQRIEAWVAEAVAGGAKLLTGGSRDGKLMRATVLTDVRDDMRVMCEEVFGPVVNIVPFDSFDEALTAVDTSPFGLQAGIFTREFNHVLTAIQHLNVGGVIINDVPSFRVDHMPYGGNKDSGVGREGPRFAIEDMTTLKMVVLTMA